MVCGVEQRHQDILIKIISSFLPTAAIYLYGSRARNDARGGSDIDLAIDAGSSVDWHVIALIKEAIEESTIPFFVDITDINEVSDDFKNEITKEWQVWKK